jgi:hypothetical protein
MNRLDLHKLVDELPDAEMDEAARILVYLLRKSGNTGPLPDADLHAEDRAWLDTDLSQIGGLDSEDDIDPSVGEPIRWDAQRGEFVVG